MANYIKLESKITYSKCSDYSLPEWSPSVTNVMASTDEAVMYDLDISTAGSETLTLPFTTISMMAIFNNTTTAANTLAVVYRTATTAAVTVVIPVGGLHITQDVNSATNPTLQFLSAIGPVRIIIVGT
jgi:hypothetical protein